MGKYNIGFSLKLPIPGQQFSNLETRFDWEETTTLPFKEALAQAKEQAKAAREELDMTGAELQLHYKSLIEDQEGRLHKAREEYIKLANKYDA